MSTNTVMTVEVDGHEIDLVRTLRVAYDVQGQHNHKPYIDILTNIGKMPLEDLIGILYASYRLGARAYGNGIAICTRAAFLEYALDNFDVSYIMERITWIIEGIMGKSPDGTAANTEAAEPEEN